MKTRPKNAGKQQKTEAKTTDTLDKKLGGQTALPRNTSAARNPSERFRAFSFLQPLFDCEERMELPSFLEVPVRQFKLFRHFLL